MRTHDDERTAWSKLIETVKPLYPFLVPMPDGYPLQHTGLGMRDYFAGQAIAGLAQRNENFGCDPKHIAATAYAIADAMLEARGEKR